MTKGAATFPFRRARCQAVEPQLRLALGRIRCGAPGMCVPTLISGVSAACSRQSQIICPSRDRVRVRHYGTSDCSGRALPLDQSSAPPNRSSVVVSRATYGGRGLVDGRTTVAAEDATAAAEEGIAVVHSKPAVHRTRHATTEMGRVLPIVIRQRRAMNDPSQSHGECLLMSDESAFGEAMAIDNSSDASRLQFQALTAVAQISIAILAHDTFRWNKRSLETSPVCNRSSNFKCRGFATGDGAIERHFFRV
ncbi:MAG: hypothetical protein QOF46_2200 [Paraburkholderia sp.]|nr:hypothetical protein [Paraburkholderia sp.]